MHLIGDCVLCGRSFLFSYQESFVLPDQGSHRESCGGCDALIHEVYSRSGPNAVKASPSVEHWMKDEGDFHISEFKMSSLSQRAIRKLVSIAVVIVRAAREPGG